MSEEDVEKAKAKQEIAKASSKAIEAAEKLGGFLSKVFGEPMAIASDMLKDKLQVLRWERRNRLIDRCEELIKSRSISGKTIAVSPRIALPILEFGSLEGDDELQDMWAKLLASAMIEESADKVRTCFVEIIKSIEIEDAHLLNKIYVNYRKWDGFGDREYSERPNRVPVRMVKLCEELSLSGVACEIAVENLFRLQCVAPYVERLEAHTMSSTVAEDFMYSDEPTQITPFTYNYGTEIVCITELGISFIELCTLNKSKNGPTHMSRNPVNRH